MATATRMKRGPTHPLAVAGVVVALLAAGLALYGSFLSERHIAGSPLNEARKEPGLVSSQTSKTTRYTLQFAAYVLPFGLGIAAALAGGEAMKAIEQKRGTYSGSLPAVLAIMVGGLSAVVSGCMILAVYVWKHIPTAYTS